MLLRQYISEAANDGTRKEWSRKAAMVGKSLQAYFGNRWNEIELIEVILPEVMQGYSEFLRSTYIPTDKHGKLIEEAQLTPEEQAKKKVVRQKNHLTFLRALLTQAMAQGLLVDCDPFASVEGYRRQQHRNNIPDVCGEIDDLLSHPSTFSGDSVAKKYLLCLGLGGIDYRDLLTVASHSDAENVMFQIGASFVDVPMSESYRKELANIHKEKALDLKDFNAQFMSRATARNLKLYASGNIFYDWLRVAKRVARLTDDNLFALVRMYLSGDNVTQESLRLYKETCEKVRKFIFTRKGAEKPYWVAVMTSWPETAEILEEKALGNPMLKDVLTENTYCPCHTKAVKVRTRSGMATTRRVVADPNRGVLRNTLFVRGNNGVWASFRKEYPEAWIMRRRGTDSYVRIPADQLNIMKTVLDAFGTTDDVEIIFDDETSATKQFEKHEEVRLVHPSFDGQIAVVKSIDTKRSTETAKYYKVEFSLVDGKKFSLSILGDLLEKITLKPA